MNPRFLLALAFAFIAATAARAQVKIIAASYGLPAPGRTIDVRRVVQSKADQGAYSFRVHVASFGADPNPGRPNLLLVEYVGPNGRPLKGRMEDGGVFNFNLVAMGIAVNQPPSRQPAHGSQVRFTNGYGRAIYVYELDRWGSWQWKAALDPGSTYTANGQVGETWIAADRSGRVLKQVRVTAGMGAVYLK